MQHEASKWLAMVKEIAPNLVRAAFVANPKTAPYYNYYLRAAEAITLSLAIDLVLSPVEVRYPRFQDRALRNPATCRSKGVGPQNPTPAVETRLPPADRSQGQSLVSATGVAYTARWIVSAHGRRLPSGADVP
jgi:hypothetical protein